MSPINIMMNLPIRYIYIDTSDSENSEYYVETTIGEIINEIQDLVRSDGRSMMPEVIRNVESLVYLIFGINI